MAKSIFVVNRSANDDVQLSLPVQNSDGTWTPGEWQCHNDQDRYSSVRRHGFRVTHIPAFWWRENSACYEVEFEELLSKFTESSLYSKVRLLRKLTEQELAQYQILIGGEHTIRSGEVAVDGMAKVTLLGNAKAKIYSAQYIEAHDCSQVDMLQPIRGLTVNAYGQSVVDVCQPCFVIAKDNVTVELNGYGEFTVSLDGKSQLSKRMRKLLRINAYNKAQITTSGDSHIYLAGKAKVRFERTLPDWD